MYDADKEHFEYYSCFEKYEEFVELLYEWWFDNDHFDLPVREDNNYMVIGMWETRYLSGTLLDVREKTNVQR